MSALVETKAPLPTNGADAGSFADDPLLDEPAPRALPEAFLPSEDRLRAPPPAAVLEARRLGLPEIGCGDCGLSSRMQSMEPRRERFLMPKMSFWRKKQWEAVTLLIFM